MLSLQEICLQRPQTLCLHVFNCSHSKLSAAICLKFLKFFLATVLSYKLYIQFSCAEIFYLNLNPVKSKYLVLRFDKQEINPEVTN